MCWFADCVIIVYNLVNEPYISPVECILSEANMCICYSSWQVGKYFWIFANNKIYWVISPSVSKREKFA